MTVAFFRFSLAAFCLFAAGAARADCVDENALYRRAQSLFSSGQYLISSIHFSQLSTSHCELAPQALFAYSLSMAELGETKEALRNLFLLESTNDPAMRARAKLFKAYLAPEFIDSLGAEPQTRLKIWGARNTESDFSALSQSTAIAPDLRVQLSTINGELKRVPAKDPWLAGGASILIPGAGQAYVGSFHSAAIAFVLNSLFLATTIEFASKNQPVAAVASGMVFSVTYIGNILNAADEAKRFNSNARGPSEVELHEALFPELKP